MKTELELVITRNRKIKDQQFMGKVDGWSFGLPLRKPSSLEEKLSQTGVQVVKIRRGRSTEFMGSDGNYSYNANISHLGLKYSYSLDSQHLTAEELRNLPIYKILSDF